MSSLLSSEIDIKDISPYGGIQRAIHIQILLSLLYAVTACSPTRTFTPTPTREVIATAMTAFVVGQVVEEDSCLRIVNEDDNLNDTLVFPPDASASIENDQVTIITGIVSGKHEEIVLDLGDWALISGGEQSHLGDELLNTMPPKCQEPPYWVVGFEVRHYQQAE